jgi:general secretion pathway protein F
MLKHIADAEQKSAERYIDRLMTIATPLLTVLVGGMVGGVVMSIMGAILSLNDMAVQ